MPWYMPIHITWNLTTLSGPLLVADSAEVIEFKQLPEDKALRRPIHGALRQKPPDQLILV